MMQVNDPAVVERLMRTKGTWAIVGLSSNEWRSAYDVSLYVRDKMGMDIIPVNLKGEDVHGEKGYRTVADIPADKHPIAVVDCFVNSQRVGAVIDQAIAIGAKAVWLQLGVFDDDAVQRARDAGLEVVVNSCPAREGWHYGM